MFLRFLFVFFSISCFAFVGAVDNYKANAEAAFTTLQKWYNSTSGIYDTTGWWNSANALTTIGNLAALDSSVKKNVTAVYANSLVQAQKYNLQMTKTIVQANFLPQSWYGSGKGETYGVSMGPALNPVGFVNGFYDDEGWWALAWIQAYDVTNNVTYLEAAADIFENMRESNKTPCGGGIWWDHANTYVNAIANELYMSVGAHLANRAVGSLNSTDYYLNLAQEQYNWFYGTGMINKNNTINDGLSITGGKCVNNNQTVWSYNQGVILGALVELSTATSNTTYLTTATTIATAGINALSQNGVLHDPCEPNCGADGTQFKGVFMRNLQKLQSAASNSVILNFIASNEASIWAKDRADGDELSVVWSGPFVSPANASTQSSAMDALVAAVAFSRPSKLGKRFAA